MKGTPKQVEWADDIRLRFRKECMDAVIERVSESSGFPTDVVIFARDTVYACEDAQVWIGLSDFDAFEILRAYSESIGSLERSITGNRPEKYPDEINLKQEKEELREFQLSAAKGEPDWKMFREQESRLERVFPVVKLGKKWKVATGTKVKGVKSLMDEERDKEGEGSVVGADGDYVIIQFLKFGFKNPKKVHTRFLAPEDPIFLDNSLWLPTGKRHFVCRSLRINFLIF